MIGSSENRISYNGNGIATEFAYTFKILEKSDIKVLHVAKDGTEELLTKDYYVDMEKSVVLYPGYAPGAEIPEQNRPPILPVGERLVLYREVPITQESALDKHWPFNVIEAGLDKLTIICQQLFDRLQRSFYVSESTSTNFDTKVPVEAGKTFRVKDDGTGFEVTEDPLRVQQVAVSVKNDAEKVLKNVLEAKNHIDQTDYKIYVGETAPTEDITNAMVWINPAEDDNGSDELAEAVTAAQNAAEIATQKADDISASAAQIETNKNDIALLKNYVTPEMFKDYDGDDWTLAFQRALNSGEMLYTANKNYKISDTIIVTGNNVGVHINGTIEYTGSSHAVEIRRLRYSNIYIKNIVSDADGIALMCEKDDEWSQYNNVSFMYLSCKGKAIHVKVTTPYNVGWINEINFLGGRLSIKDGIGEYGAYLDYPDLYSGSGIRFFHVGFEGSTNGLYAKNCSSLSLIECRHAEFEGDKFITTEGMCNLFVSDCQTFPYSMLHLSSGTYGRLQTRIYTDTFTFRVQDTIISKGKISGKENYYGNLSDKNSEGILDTEDKYPVLKPCSFIGYGNNGAVTLKLDSSYLCPNGINCIRIKLTKKDINENNFFKIISDNKGEIYTINQKAIADNVLLLISYRENDDVVSVDVISGDLITVNTISTTTGKNVIITKCRNLVTLTISEDNDSISAYVPYIVLPSEYYPIMSIQYDDVIINNANGNISFRKDYVSTAIRKHISYYAKG